MSNATPIEQLRAICLALPEATEEDMGASPRAFKVGDKLFVMRHPADVRPSFWCKSERGFQEMITVAEPERFFVPPYVGRHGWIGVWLDVDQDWDQIADLIRTSYRLTAPKRLIKQLSDSA